MLVVTSYFNPMNSHRRLTNYRAFRSRLNAPLLTVELSFDGQFELTSADADHLIQLSGGDVMWQKERLLNIGLRAVSPHIEDIAWIDCDVVFERPDWAEAARRCLKNHSMVQLFSDVIYLNPHEEVDSVRSLTRESVPGSMRFIERHGVDILAKPNITIDGKFQHCPGMAFAMKRTIADLIGFYDATIIGGGDWVQICAFYGRFDIPPELLNFNPKREQHYKQWAEHAYSAVAGRLGYVPGNISHLWHGDLKNRKYFDRHRILDDLDPCRDIELTPDGAWRWTDPSTEMAQNVRAYFRSRREDG
jgi:hypothetical protein